MLILFFMVFACMSSAQGFSFIETVFTAKTDIPSSFTVFCNGTATIRQITSAVYDQYDVCTVNLTSEFDAICSNKTSCTVQWPVVFDNKTAPCVSNFSSLSISGVCSNHPLIIVRDFFHPYETGVTQGCADSVYTLECSPFMTIEEISQVIYGHREACEVDLTSQVSKLCRGKTACQIRWPQDFPGSSLSCITNLAAFSVSGICSGNLAVVGHLPVPQNLYMSQCTSPAIIKDISSATYGTERCFVEILSQVQDLCLNQNSCNLSWPQNFPSLVLPCVPDFPVFNVVALCSDLLPVLHPSLPPPYILQCEPLTVVESISLAMYGQDKFCQIEITSQVMELCRGKTICEINWPADFPMVELTCIVELPIFSITGFCSNGREINVFPLTLFPPVDNTACALPTGVVSCPFLTPINGIKTATYGNDKICVTDITSQVTETCMGLSECFVMWPASFPKVDLSCAAELSVFSVVGTCLVPQTESNSLSQSRSSSKRSRSRSKSKRSRSKSKSKRSKSRSRSKRSKSKSRSFSPIKNNPSALRTYIPNPVNPNLLTNPGCDDIGNNAADVCGILVSGSAASVWLITNQTACGGVYKEPFTTNTVIANFTGWRNLINGAGNLQATTRGWGCMYQAAQIRISGTQTLPVAKRPASGSARIPPSGNGAHSGNNFFMNSCGLSSTADTILQSQRIILSGDIPFQVVDAGLVRTYLHYYRNSLQINSTLSERIRFFATPNSTLPFQAFDCNATVGVAGRVFSTINWTKQECNITTLPPLSRSIDLQLITRSFSTVTGVNSAQYGMVDSMMLTVFTSACIGLPTVIPANANTSLCNATYTPVGGWCNMTCNPGFVIVGNVNSRCNNTWNVSNIMNNTWIEVTGSCANSQSRSRSVSRRSKSRSISKRSRSKSISKRSKSRSSSKRSRSRSTSQQSRSLSISKQSKSRSVSKQSRSLSISKQSKSRSASKQSKSLSISKQSKSRSASKQSRSLSISKQSKSRSVSKKSRSSSVSKQSKSRSVSKQSKSRSLSKQSKSRSVSKQSRSRSISKQSKSGSVSKASRSLSISKQSKSGSLSGSRSISKKSRSRSISKLSRTQSVSKNSKSKSTSINSNSHSVSRSRSTSKQSRSLSASVHSKSGSISKKSKSKSSSRHSRSKSKSKSKSHSQSSSDSPSMSTSPSVSLSSSNNLCYSPQEINLIGGIVSNYESVIQPSVFDVTYTCPLDYSFCSFEYVFVGGITGTPVCSANKIPVGRNSQCGVDMTYLSSHRCMGKSTCFFNQDVLANAGFYNTTCLQDVWAYRMTFQLVATCCPVKNENKSVIIIILSVSFGIIVFGSLICSLMPTTRKRYNKNRAE